LKKIITIFFIVFVIPVFAAPSDLASVQKQILATEVQNKKLEKQVAVSDREVEKTKKQLVGAASKLDKIESERGTILEKISDLDSRRDKLLLAVNAGAGAMDDAAAAMAIMTRNPGSAADSARDYVLTSVLLSGVSDGFDAEITSMQSKIKELEKVLEQRKSQQKKLDKTAKKYAQDKSYLDKLMRTRSAQNEKLKSRQYELQQKLRNLSARAKNLSELTAGISDKEVSSDDSFSWRKMRSPVRGIMLRRFGEKSPLGLVSDGWLIKTRSDALVSAPADGTIEFSDNFKKNGRVIIISHKNSYYSVLTGLASSDVLVGQNVLAGEPIGRMPDGRAEMYLELRRGARAIDPARLFNEP
jgi:septal ring factor EnvC (AmiA/AmiB activator)